MYPLFAVGPLECRGPYRLGIVYSRKSDVCNQMLSNYVSRRACFFRVTLSGSKKYGVYLGGTRRTFVLSCAHDEYVAMFLGERHMKRLFIGKRLIGNRISR